MDASDDDSTRQTADGDDADSPGDQAVRSTETHRGRDVVVPMRLYKTVTVFSTLLAILGVVVGFVLLDAATIRLSLLRRFVLSVLEAVGVSPPATVLSAVLAVAGLAAICFGAGVYILGTRFRARGMGNPQEDADESPDNG
ncbi:DUF7315 family membrane protein [Haloplanus halobius]|uniref:DUF7315 family membrane protein n=1 Tax=Haloplanus halobius TaxID=2934938 RepID=UPI00200C1D7F|nr:hypothetical protein [Haloplanus sp. XH21]